MSFDQEWAELRQAAQTRLNSAGPGHGGLPDVKINASGKTAAVNALETQIQPGVRKAGVVADDSTTGAVTAFTGWQTGSGLKDAHAEWEKQVESLRSGWPATRRLCARPGATSSMSIMRSRATWGR